MQSLKHKNTKKGRKKVIAKDKVKLEQNEDKGSNRLKPVNTREE
jgi:hypothetical protein